MPKRLAISAAERLDRFSTSMRLNTSVEFLGCWCPTTRALGVSRACRFPDPDLNPTYQEMAMPYGVGVRARRVRMRPQDKAKVEAGVQIVRRWVRGSTTSPAVFPPLEDLNRTIRELLEQFEPAAAVPGKHATDHEPVYSLLSSINAQRPLPAKPFDMGQWSRARVNIDYHIAFGSQPVQRA